MRAAGWRLAHSPCCKQAAAAQTPRLLGQPSRHRASCATSCLALPRPFLAATAVVLMCRRTSSPRRAAQRASRRITAYHGRSGSAHRPAALPCPGLAPISSNQPPIPRGPPCPPPMVRAAPQEERRSGWKSRSATGQPALLASPPAARQQPCTSQAAVTSRWSRRMGDRTEYAHAPTLTHACACGRDARPAPARRLVEPAAPAPTTSTSPRRRVVAIVIPGRDAQAVPQLPIRIPTNRGGKPFGAWAIGVGIGIT